MMVLGTGGLVIVNEVPVNVVVAGAVMPGGSWGITTQN